MHIIGVHFGKVCKLAHLGEDQCLQGLPLLLHRSPGILHGSLARLYAFANPPFLCLLMLHSCRSCLAFPVLDRC